MKSFKELRKKIDLTTDDAAAKLGITKSMLYKVEQGYRNPSPKLMKSMSLLYECSIQDVFSALNITDSDIHIKATR